MASLTSDKSRQAQGAKNRWGVLLWGRSATQVREPLDTAAQIATPENIEFSYISAGPLSRALAFLFDVMLWLFVYGSLWFLVMMISSFLAIYLVQFGLQELVEALSEMAMGLALLSFFLSYWLMWGVCETFFNGRTPGKWVFGLRVVTTSGHPIRGWQAMVRTLVRSIEVMPSAPPMLILGSFIGSDAMLDFESGEPASPWLILPTGLVALVCMIVAPRFRRLGDLVSGTCVVFEHRGWRPGLAVLEDPRTAALAELIPSDFRVRRELARAISSYVHKRRYLAHQRRREIAQYVVEPLLVRFGLPADTSYDLVLCALYHRTFVVELGSETRRALTEQSVSTESGAIRAELPMATLDTGPTLTEGNSWERGL